jgi:hypothetical protein
MARPSHHGTPLAALAAAALLGSGCRETLSSSAQFGKDTPRAYEALLSRVVTDDGLVDYDALEADRGPLDSYVGWLAADAAWQGRLTKDWHSQYLNAYNALVLFQVLERGRPASVLDVQGLVPIRGFKFFHFTQFALGDETVSLSEIENERIRWKEMDHRDHAALNCASMSCPPLRAELYRNPTLERQLDDQMRRWLDDPERGVRIEGDGEARTAVFSPIFDWYARDFSFFTAGLDPCAIAAEHVSDRGLREELQALSQRGCPRRYFDYDWSLNDASSSSADAP